MMFRIYLIACVVAVSAFCWAQATGRALFVFGATASSGRAGLNAPMGSHIYHK